MKIKTTDTIFFSVDYSLVLTDIKADQNKIDKDYLLLVIELIKQVKVLTGIEIVPTLNSAYRIRSEEIQNVLTVAGDSIESKQLNNDEASWKKAVVIFCDLFYKALKYESDDWNITLGQDSFNVHFRNADTHYSAWDE